MKGIFAVFAVVAILAGCQNGQASKAAIADEKALAGEWTSSGDLEMHLTLKDGGSLVYCKGELCAMGKWKTDGVKLMLNYFEGDKNVELELTMLALSNGQLQCTFSTGKPISFTKGTNQN
ncbi:MAG: hypothetical protein A2Y33_10690 [Spirochaetes bacterium GWF1_51_8]|nr:MAG: hypothetical protein A2Y33_10690 [Spirochaetes bacterium GWF1_51_8]